MEFAIQRCCIAVDKLGYAEFSMNAVLQVLGVGFRDLREFKCCGSPLKNYNMKAYVLSSARNLAVAEKESIDIMTACACCFGGLKGAEHYMREDPELRDEINAILSGEGLRYEGQVVVKHFLQVLHDDIGVDEIEKRVRKRLDGLRVAVHYGCHLLRPERVVRFDKPFAPSKLDRLVEVTGAKSITWQDKLECCGSPLLGVNDELSMDLTGKKIASAKQAGADCLVVACPYCETQFDRVQKMMAAKRNPGFEVPSMLYAQFLGLALGIPALELGLNPDRLPGALVNAA